ncbi:CoA transferase [Streptomyces sp. NPDC096132]|uniref:CoA transferase n=1 Tax=Streptomyces sp. NPDC096132 TaxID=3366075 RepID=UPI0037FEFD68
MLVTVGIPAAGWKRERPGRGQVVDTAMTEGAALIIGILHGPYVRGPWREERGGNLLDGSAPLLPPYVRLRRRPLHRRRSDRAAVLVPYAGTTRPHSRRSLPPQLDPDGWPELSERLTRAFATRGRDAWVEIFESACLTPVLSLFEAHHHPHNAVRGTFTEVAATRRSAPAPRLSRPPLSSSRSCKRTAGLRARHGWSPLSNA